MLEYIETVIKFQKQADNGLNTMADLTVARVGQFNALCPTPPTTSTVTSPAGQVTMPVRYWALSSDANLDGSPINAADVVVGPNVVHFYPRTISDNEIVPLYEAHWYQFGEPANTFQALYNLMGTATDLAYTTKAVTVPNNPSVTVVSPVYATSQFMLNDFVVTMASQSYQVNPSAFTTLTPLPNAYPGGGNNHNSVPNQRIADLIINKVKSLGPH